MGVVARYRGYNRRRQDYAGEFLADGLSAHVPMVWPSDRRRYHRFCAPGSLTLAALLPGWSYADWFPGLEERFREFLGYIWPAVALVAGLILAAWLMDLLGDVVTDITRLGDPDDED